MSLVTRGLGANGGLVASFGLGRRVLVRVIDVITTVFTARSRPWSTTALTRPWTDVAVERVYSVAVGTRDWAVSRGQRTWIFVTSTRSWSLAKARAWLADADRSWNRSDDDGD